MAAAHRIPSSALVLGADGKQGVRFVHPDGKVGFQAIEVLEETPEGVWVSGLGGPVNLIVAGQSYVSEGQTVRIKASTASDRP